MRKAIVVGASTGIGREVAIRLSEKGFEVGLAARRIELLTELQRDLPGRSHLVQMDVADTPGARNKMAELIRSMGHADLVILIAGVGIPNPTWEDEQTIIRTNVSGFVALANLTFEYFKRRGKGCLAGVSSVAGLRGGRRATAYCASKAFISNYMEGLRCRIRKEKLNITVTDVIPGFVETPMTASLSYKFWTASPGKAARQMIAAILRRRSRIYVTRRWVLVALILKIMPAWLYSKI